MSFSPRRPQPLWQRVTVGKLVWSHKWTCLCNWAKSFVDCFPACHQSQTALTTDSAAGLNQLCSSQSNLFLLLASSEERYVASSLSYWPGYTCREVGWLKRYWYIFRRGLQTVLIAHAPKKICQVRLNIFIGRTGAARIWQFKIEQLKCIVGCTYVLVHPV